MIQKTLYLLLFFSSFSFSQFDDLDLTPADSLMQEGKIKDAIIEFETNYQKGNRDTNYLYNYACALAEDSQFDKSFAILRESLDLEIKLNPLFDPDFLNLRTDKRWNSFEDELISKIELEYKTIIVDKEYAKKLWKMRALDQAYYFQIHLAERKIGKNTTVVNTLWKVKNNINKENLEKLEKLIQQKGFPKKSLVGNNAVQAAFLIIQHADLQTQKKYVSTIEDLCKKKEADSQSFAYLYDRIEISEGRPQKYGTQVKYNKENQQYELYPLVDKEKVDFWRKEIGLSPINEYLSGYGIKI
ncbi:hypothetical protein GOQ30_11585 [Flavobacterium sp. TP390]|uniref:Tetratricopeptide repeat protein n=1 Tax=Flavobacterium profundi TaxID=1774945 RepID=A0A6I4IM71_9FLAO|nr:DUF6624 domain-containing protein [Flavobacterium profundi]MVO09801.1 hypothetical protein [Flavobacterium profundi]